MNKFFSDLATLLEAADAPDLKDKMYRSARKMCRFHEVNGINLGFASSSYGAGWGEVLTNQFLNDAYQIVKKGCKQPEIFHLVSLFEENVAGDQVSDMIATIIEPDIRKYTLRVMSELGVTKDNYPQFRFSADGLVQNPYKAAPILFCLWKFYTNCRSQEIGMIFKEWHLRMKQLGKKSALRLVLNGLNGHLQSKKDI